MPQFTPVKINAYNRTVKIYNDSDFIVTKLFFVMAVFQFGS